MWLSTADCFLRQASWLDYEHLIFEKNEVARLLLAGGRLETCAFSLTDACGRLFDTAHKKVEGSLGRANLTAQQDNDGQDSDTTRLYIRCVLRTATPRRRCDLVRANNTLSVSHASSNPIPEPLTFMWA